jgi:hypothetical protein
MALKLDKDIRPVARPRIESIGRMAASKGPRRHSLRSFSLPAEPRAGRDISLWRLVCIAAQLARKRAAFIDPAHEDSAF